MGNAHPLPTYGAVTHPAVQNKLRILREVSGSEFLELDARRSLHSERLRSSDLQGCTLFRFFGIKEGYGGAHPSGEDVLAGRQIPRPLILIKQSVQAFYDLQGRAPNPNLHPWFTNTGQIDWVGDYVHWYRAFFESKRIATTEPRDCIRTPAILRAPRGSVRQAEQRGQAERDRRRLRAAACTAAIPRLAAHQVHKDASHRGVVLRQRRFRSRADWRLNPVPRRETRV